MIVLSKRLCVGVLLGVLLLLLVGVTRTQAQPPVDPTYRVGFISGNFKIFATYLITNSKAKAKEFSGCHDLVIGYPDGWEMLGVQSFGKEDFCYDVAFRLKDGAYKICRIDLRSFSDQARNNQVIELHFKEDGGDINFVPSSKAR